MLAKDPSGRPDAATVAETLAKVSFAPRWSYKKWLRLVPLLLLCFYPASAPPAHPLDALLEDRYSDFDVALFAATIAAAKAQLQAAEEAMVILGPAQAYQRARLQYKQAALAKERGAIDDAMQLFEGAQGQWRPLTASHPAQAYKALSICADGIGEMYYHRGEYERALGQYQDAAHTLPRTLAAAQSIPQVPSFLDYQRALVYREQGEAVHALSALEDAEDHERVLVAQANAAPVDRWQLARVLTLKARILMQQHNLERAFDAAAEAETLSRKAGAEVPDEKRFQLDHLLALDTLAEVSAARGQILKAQEDESLAGLHALVQGDPDHGRWVHALAEVLVRRAQRSHGAHQAELAREALALMQQMERRGQWLKDVHLRQWGEIAVELAVVNR